MALITLIKSQYFRLLLIMKIFKQIINKNIYCQLRKNLTKKIHIKYFLICFKCRKITNKKIKMNLTINHFTKENLILLILSKKIFH